MVGKKKKKNGNEKNLLTLNNIQIYLHKTVVNCNSGNWLADYVYIKESNKLRDQKYIIVNTAYTVTVALGWATL